VAKLRIIKPFSFELVDRHRPIAPGRIGQQHAVYRNRFFGHKAALCGIVCCDALGEGSS
jgi:hypothetical protein